MSSVSLPAPLPLHTPRAPRTAPLRRTALKDAHLDLVCALAEAGSLRSAAQALGLSQPALSRQLQQLEQRLSASVVERLPGGVRLTPTGERLLGLAQSLRRVEAQWLHASPPGPTQLRGEVHICGYSSVLRPVILPALAPLVRQHPGLTLLLKSEELYRIPQRGVSGEADLFLTQVPVHLEGYVSWTLGHELNLLIESSTLSTAPAVYLDHEPNDRFTEHYLAVTDQQSVGPLRRAFLDDIYGLLDGVQLGLGRAVVPLHLIRPAAGVRPVPGAPALRVPVVLNVRQSLLELRLFRTVVDTLRTDTAALLPAPPPGLTLVDAPYAGPLHRLGD